MREQNQFAGSVEVFSLGYQSFDTSGFQNVHATSLSGVPTITTDADMAAAKVAALAQAQCRKCVVIDDATVVISGLQSVLTALDHSAAVFLTAEGTSDLADTESVLGVAVPANFPFVSQGDAILCTVRACVWGGGSVYH